MPDIDSALVVGAGAVGSAIASIIHKRSPGAVSILADEARAQRFRQEGFFVNGERLDFPLLPAGQAPRQGAEPGLLIVAVKNHQLRQAIADMAPYVGPDTLILSLLNGISSEDDLAAAFGREKVLYAMILAIDAVREGNATRFASSGTISFGDATNEAGHPSERVARVASFFSRMGVSYAIPPDMIRTLWYKLMVNVGINQSSAVLRAPYGLFQKSAAGREVMESAMREVVAVSAALGTGLAAADIESWEKTLGGLAPDAKTSMLQDVEAGRKTEVEIFAGAIVALGARASVPTPVNAFLLNLIHAIEEKQALAP